MGGVLGGRFRGRDYNGPVRILLSILLASPAAWAEVYRCEQDGKTVYTDRPCAQGAAPYAAQKPMTVLPATPAASATELEKAHDARAARERQNRDAADAEWLRQHQAKKDKAERVRGGMVRGEAVPGMSPVQVRSAMGEPDELSGETGHERWRYREADGTLVTVQFKNGEVSKVSRQKKKKGKH